MARKDIILKKAGQADHPTIMALWRRSVEATHSFLTKDDLDDIEREIPGLLAKLELWTAVKEKNVIGFMGLDNHNVEALFVDPDHFGQGAGSELLGLARKIYGSLQLDVNEQNPKALEFYLHCGFEVVGRSPADKQGRRFPLIHLKLES
ncbi:MAG: acetyltransferase [Deltaproteobacteria bacterium]|jgi:putative acetyltransferase|nr:acetyltransferase [Deltaproteobacteria bacterium]